MQTNKKWFFYWFPRIAGIVFIAFISMFALDIFWNWYSFWQTVVGLFMHLIPTWILIIVLVLSRKRYPLIGAVAFIWFGVRYTTINVISFFRATQFESMPAYYYLIWPLIIALPALLVGLCFLQNRWSTRKNKA